MKKQIIFLLRIVIVALLVINFTGLAAQSSIVKFDHNWDKQGISLSSQDKNGLIVNVSVNAYGINETIIDNTLMSTVTTEGVLLQNNEGAPNLPSFSNYIAVPQGATVITRVVRKETKGVDNILIAPSPVIPKDDDISPLLYKKDDKIYTDNQFYPKDIVTVSSPSKIRGVDVVLIGINPFQYNPVTKQMIVNKDIEIEISFEGGNGQFGEDRLRSRWWDPILRDAVLNQASIKEVDYSSRETKETGFEYLIIVPDDDEYISWADSIRDFRIMQGITTVVVTTTEIGGNTVSAIESYINNAYHTWDIPPVAVLLLADFGTSGNTIISPIYNSYCASDNIYADVDGDHLPEIIFARMTAQNAIHLETFVTKVLNYERNPPINPDFYNHPITALGWQTQRWFQICSETVGGFFKNTQGKDPVRINAIYDGDPNIDPWSIATNTSTVLAQFGPNGLGYIPASPSELGGWTGGNATAVNNAINDGAFILQHRDHGGTTGWGEPGYSSSNIDGLVNTDLAFIFSINCLTGKFNMNGECFAEKFHRYKNNDMNSGALGIIAASEVSYSFVNDTYVWGMYDNMWPDFLPEYGTTPESRGVLPAFGNVGGKYFLEQSSWPYNENNKEVTYNLFHHHGDAFSMVYSEIPQNLSVIHDPVFIASETSFVISADANSFIALTVNNEIIGTAEGTGNTITINIAPQLPTNEIIVTVTKQNFYRYEYSVEVIPPEGAYIIYEDIAINDNNIMGTGESILASISMKNIGVEDGESISVVISTDDEYIMITDDNEDYENITSGSTSTIPDGFAWEVSNDIPDMHNVLFSIESTDGIDTWISSMNIIGHAPQLSMSGITINDINQGNGNGNLDPGETVDIVIDTYNYGSYIATNTLSYLTSTSQFVTIINADYDIGDIQISSTGTAVFSIIVNQDTPVGEVIDFIYHAQSGEYYLENLFSKTSGLTVEDWESGEMNQFNWETGGDANWEISTSDSYEGTYCIKSGEINDSEQSWLSIEHTSAADDSISFYAMSSSEQSHDFFKFYIDNQLRLIWTNEMSWRRMAFFVSEGTHVFKWEYSKDPSVSFGEDCARVDYIVLPESPVTSAFAGDDINFCETDILQCNGTSSYCDSILWMTSGTGFFNNDHELTPIYQASAEDINNESVILTLTAYGPVETVSDDVVFTIGKTPVAYSGETGFTCSNEIFNLESAYAENATSIEWTTLGDGTFDDATAVNPNYSVGATDTENGITSLVMTVTGGEACEQAISEFELLVAAVTEANAGIDADICSMLTYTLADATAANYAELMWTTTGDGSFDDASSEHPTYSPGENDILTKEVTLTLTATSETVCPTIVDDILLTLYCTGIEDINSAIGFEIFPNPNNGAFTLTLDGVVNEDAVIRVFNSTGKVVFVESNVQLTNSYSNTIDLSVEPGIYTIRVEGNITNIAKKIIIK